MEKSLIVKKIVVTAFILFVSISLFSKIKLPKKYEEWLKSVEPIMTEIEKKVFLSLTSDKERDLFIQLFWKQRDPTPGTPRNEFYEEYQRRLNYVDRMFGRGSVKRGRETERGKIYLLLGPPLERQVFDTYSNLYPCELWYYKGKPEWGLPPYFYLIFYQPQGIGEYKLYHPSIVGPEGLVLPSLYQPLNRQTAYRIIKGISAELASATLSLIPADSTGEFSPLSSEALLARIRNVPEKQISDKYALEFKYYKDYVEVDYTANYIECNSKVKIFKLRGQNFIHWSLEPKKISFGQYKNKFYSSFELTIKIEDLKGVTIYQDTENIPLEINEEQYQKHKNQPFAFQGILPIIPGNYRLFFLLKNKVSKEFTSTQYQISVPQQGEEFYLSNLLIYFAKERVEGLRGIKAFQFGNRQFFVSSENTFNLNSKLGVYFQIINCPQVLIEKGKAQIVIKNFANNEIMFSKEIPLIEIYDNLIEGFDISSIDLKGLNPAFYWLEINIISKNQEKILSEKEKFSILPLNYPVYPWIFSRYNKFFPHHSYFYIIGTQYFSLK
ncbi:GWxTD domain-containing protein, partial [Candidatus Aminicenantes bacterium AC-335-L06]|nr:GWxTD domain-containing protein [Candidatus Aminicenantes bacterium AC-335-L06]